MRTVVSLGIFFTILFIFSCRKNDINLTHNGNIGQTGLSLEEGKSYFNQLYSTNATNRQGNSPINMWPKWSMSYSNENRKRQQYLEVPVITEKKKVILFLEKDSLSNTDKQQQKSSAFQTLVIYRDRANKIYYRLVSYIGSPKYLQRHNYNISHNRIGKLDNDFEGYLNYSDERGEYLFSLKIENGKPIQKIDKRNASQKKTIPVVQTFGGHQVCEERCIETTEWSCWQTIIIVCKPVTGECVEEEGEEWCGNAVVDVECFEECYWVEEDPNPPCYDPTTPSGECDDPFPGEGGEEGDESTWGTDCSSFVFQQTSTANWQEAGLNKIRLKWVWTDLSSGQSIAKELWVDHVVYGLPMKYSNGQVLTPGQAATISAQMTEDAKKKTYQEFRNSPYQAPDNTVITYFKNALHNLMVTNGGTAGTTGSGSPHIIFRDEKRAFFGTFDCK